MNNKELIKLLAKVELARHNFYYFCLSLIPAVYKDKPYLKKFCDDLENFWNDDTKKYLTISMPPRHCKSLTISLFVCYLLKNKDIKIMTGSYNEDFSSLMCKNIRDRIQEEKVDTNRIIYQDIFNSKILRGAAQAHKFKIDGSNNINVLSTSINGSATGFGCNLIILDDMLKSAAESYNIKVKDKIYDWFINTMLSRLEGDKQKVILIGTRWCKDDLIGRVLDWQEDNIVEIKLRAKNENGEMLCDTILNSSHYEELKKRQSEEIFMANYQQEPMDLKDRMYNVFNTYIKEDLKDNQGKIIAYVDTADTGKDYLCCIIAKIIERKIYILDIYYTQKSMETTEEEVAIRLKDFEVHNCRIESNNGGRGFARNVKRISDNLGNKITDIKYFTQTKNKNSRIFSNRQNIMNYIYYPKNWDLIYPEFFKSMVEYKMMEQNEHDDAQDCLTGIFETVEIMGYIK